MGKDATLIPLESHEGIVVEEIEPLFWSKTAQSAPYAWVWS